GKQKPRPKRGGKGYYVFADEVQIRRPEAAGFVFGAADGAKVGRERIEPDVKDVRLLTRNGDAPANRGARDAEVFQPTFDEADDFVAPRFRLNEIGVLLIKIEQRLLKCRQLEEIVFFGEGFQRPAAVRAKIAGFRIGHKIVVVNAVLAGVVAFVDVIVLAAEAEEPLHGADVLQIGGTDEF